MFTFGLPEIALDGQITATDVQIDRAVYDLYELIGDEIKIMEGTI